MKINKWTLGLAAVGLVTLGSTANAEEKLSVVQTALSSTTLSGYVDASAIWRSGTGGTGPLGTEAGTVGRLYDVNSTGQSKQDGFNLNVVSLTLDKPLDEGQWSAGYHVQTLIGPDAQGRGTGLTQPAGVNNGIALHEAYIALRAPVGNGLDLKFGQFGTFVGYEAFDTYKNPNYSRSYGFFIEPSAHVGATATYTFADWVNATVGMGNSYSTAIDAKAALESKKTYLAIVNFTAPESMGSLKGSTLSIGYDNGQANGGYQTLQNFYLGGTIATPVAGLSVGLAYDYQSLGSGAAAGSWANTYALYLSFQASEKLKLNGRIDFAKSSNGVFYTAPGANDNELLAFTLTADYSLWENVVTRAELRWDKSIGGDAPFAATTGNTQSLTAALNVIYKF